MTPPEPRDAGLSALAAIQGGMVSVQQLREAELSKDAVRRRKDKGLLIDQGRGVYAFGYPRKDDLARAWRAVLMYPRTALRQQSAGWVHGLRNELGRVHLSSMTERRSSSVAQVHTVKTPEIEIVRGLPCTTLAQTLLDCAATLPPDHVTKMLHRAEELRTFDLNPILPLLNEARGSPALREALQIHKAQGNFSQSELERRFTILIANSNLPRPERNLFVLDFWVDAHWPDARVVVELDGGIHRTVSQQESDTRRFAILMSAGFRPVRFTWWQVTEDPHHILRTLEAMLGI